MREQEGGCDYIKAAYMGDYLNQTIHKVANNEKVQGLSSQSPRKFNQDELSNIVVRGVGLNSLQFTRGKDASSCLSSSAFSHFDLRLSWNESLQIAAADAIDTILYGNFSSTNQSTPPNITARRSLIAKAVGTSLPYMQPDGNVSSRCFAEGSSTAFCSLDINNKFCPCVPVLGEQREYRNAQEFETAKQQISDAQCTKSHQCSFVPATSENDFKWGVRVLNLSSNEPPCGGLDKLREDKSLVNKTSNWNPKKLLDCYCFSKLDRLVKSDGLGSGLLSFIDEDSDVCASNM